MQASPTDLDQALRRDPGDLRALILKADQLHAAGDARAAAAFYRRALGLAPPPAQAPAELRADLQRAEAMCRRYAAQFEQALREGVAARAPAASSARFEQSLDILCGRRQIYFQQPRYYLFPGLPQIQFYERSLLPWLEAVESATADIRAELMPVLEERGAFRPYVQAVPGRPRQGNEGMVDNPDWSAFYLWKDGEAVAANAARCPKTLAALERAPLCRVTQRSPSILFSLMRPGAHIPPHNGMVNTRLICHLPLMVPGRCTFRVGNETREWAEGEAWAFDDTIEHEAWNRSDRTRVILLFEIWRPELTAAERHLVNAMFESIDAHTGEKPAWEI